MTSSSSRDDDQQDARPEIAGIAANRRGSVFGFSIEPARFEVERPVRVTPPKALFGSDLIAETLRELDIPFVSMTSGPVLGELNDSLVNYLGNTRPQLLSCLDDEIALAMAHGYAKVTGRPMAVALSQGAPLAPGSTLCAAKRDAVPLVVLETADAPHEPASPILLADFAPTCPGEARYAILQANRMAQAQPQGPVRVTLSRAVQSASVAPLDTRRNPQRYRARVSNGAGRADVAELAAMLLEAERPLILAGLVSRSPAGWDERVRLAELLGAQVHAAAGNPAAFPTDHPLFLPEISPSDLSQSDVLLSLDWPDLAGFTRGSYRERNPHATIIEVSPDVARKLARGGECDTPTPSDMLIEADVDQVIGALVEEMGDISSPHQSVKHAAVAPEPPGDRTDGPLSRADVTRALSRIAASRALCVASVPRSWPMGGFAVQGPLDYLGAGNSAPAQAIGSALALVGSDRMTAAVVGAAGFIAGAAALWTAAHYRIPLMLLVISEPAGDGSSDGQAPIAQARGRTAENAWIGHRISQPEVDICALAESLGALGLDAGSDYTQLGAALAKAVHHVEKGGVAVVDVRLS